MEIIFEYFSFDAFYPALSEAMIREDALANNPNINK